MNYSILIIVFEEDVVCIWDTKSGNITSIWYIPNIPNMCKSVSITSNKCQYTFNGCKDKKKLPFDFAVFDEKRNLLFLVEYDGEHHFHPVRYKTFQNADKNYSICKKHDEIKNNFCKRNNIDLVRIPYYERKDLYKILYKKLRQYNLLK